MNCCVVVAVAARDDLRFIVKSVYAFFEEVEQKYVNGDMVVNW